jgi:hypothetical protein
LCGSPKNCSVTSVKPRDVATCQRHPQALHALQFEARRSIARTLHSKHNSLTRGVVTQTGYGIGSARQHQPRSLTVAQRDRRRCRSWPGCDSPGSSRRG